MHRSSEPFLSENQIQDAVTRLAGEISERYRNRDNLVLVVVLKGGTVFASDLMRQIPLPLAVEYIRAKSYDGIDFLGDVLLPVLPEQPLRGKSVLVIEDILDTGRTTSAIMKTLSEHDPASLELCVLLDKPSRRVVPVDAQYIGITIEDRFVVGYGLDHDERFRNLPEIYTLEED
ncbi:MAG: hypoxanthine phosphoribosyltransferase [Candidatus Hydrogenedentes bacterium]|nr:hypoxanthine phosphoribosyltransferase [Candidatus Hydrogenedentota bacterium]